MAAFETEVPGMVITAATTVTPDDGRKIRHAEGGEMRGRNAYAATVYRINVVVKGDLAIKVLLETMYAAYTDVMNTITIDDSDYSAMFVSPPAVTGKDGDIRWLKFGLQGFEV